MSGKTIVIQPGTTQTAAPPRRTLAAVVAVLAVSAAIAFGSMSSNESTAVADTADPRVDYGIRHRYVPDSDPAESYRSQDYGLRHLADWRELESMTTTD
jgi:hypothetical protein